MRWLLRFQTSSFSRCSSQALEHAFSGCSTVCGIFPDQGLNLYLLHWQVDSSPLRKPLSSILQLRKPRPGEVTELDQCEQRGEAAVAMETLPAHLGTSSLVSSVVLSDRHLLDRKMPGKRGLCLNHLLFLPQHPPPNRYPINVN